MTTSLLIFYIQSPIVYVIFQSHNFGVILFFYFALYIFQFTLWQPVVITNSAILVTRKLFNWIKCFSIFPFSKHSFFITPYGFSLQFKYFASGESLHQSLFTFSSYFYLPVTGTIYQYRLCPQCLPNGILQDKGLKIDPQVPFLLI